MRSSSSVFNFCLKFIEFIIILGNNLINLTDDDDILQLELAGINYDEIEFELESVERCFWLDGMRWYDYKFKNSNKIYTTKSCDLNEGPMKAAKRILKNPRTNRNKKPFGIR